MKITKFVLCALFILFSVSCGSSYSDSFHMDKPIWAPEDYDLAISEIERAKINNEAIPCLSNPELAPVFLKLVSSESVIAILSDNELGLKHRAEVGEEYFRIAQNIEEIYGDLDVQDKFVYPRELVMAIDLFLTTQNLYFKVGNENIKKNSVNPEQNIESNKETVINNFGVSVDFLIREDALDDASIKELAQILDKQFTLLVKTFPTSAAYGNLKIKAEKSKLKVKSSTLKQVLTRISNESIAQLPKNVTIENNVLFYN